MTPAQPLPCPFCGAPGERAGSMVVCSKICHGCYAIDEKLWNRRPAAPCVVLPAASVRSDNFAHGWNGALFFVKQALAAAGVAYKDAP